ncbi:hypothetical protein K144316041_p20180 (plasmid) [Clostridium tetani]|uniref:hypothetical protein n=1 Tax=Clostridium tetani TaxID=1513 RepID=UPI002953EC6E|nr:hypothetical protein [Clostridium tetani]BDR74179.1 hypothetical protein K144316041_p20180 [Clostridium tetani]
MSKEVFSKKVKSVFLGKRVRKYWEIQHGYKPELTVRTETLERVKILEKEMNFEFKEGEEIYLDEQGKYATIEKKARDTNGNIVYNITYVTEIIEDFDSNIKEQYEKECIEEKTKREKQELEKIERNKEYEDFCKQKENIPKRGLIIIRPSKGKKADLGKVSNYERYVNKKFIDYDVVTFLGNTEIFNYDKYGKVVSVKEDKITNMEII